jgi:hypothetical protein
VVVVCAVVASAGGLLYGTQFGAQPVAVPATVAPAAVLAAQRAVGVACGLGTPGCDRIGLALWLRGRVTAAHGSLDGRELALRGAGAHGEFTGFANDRALVERTAAIRRATPIGRRPAELRPLLRVLVRFADGHTSTTALRVPLAPVWG